MYRYKIKWEFYLYSIWVYYCPSSYYKHREYLNQGLALMQFALSSCIEERRTRGTYFEAKLMRIQCPTLIDNEMCHRAHFFRRKTFIVFHAYYTIILSDRP